MTATHEWWTTVSFGGGLVRAYPMPPRGPWRSEDEAHEALQRWRLRVGHLAGTIMAAHSVRLVGPLPSRREAREADISTHPGRPL